MLSPRCSCACGMIIDASLDLRKEYQAQLKSEKEGALEMLGFARDRAIGTSWYDTIVKMLQRFAGGRTANRLNLTPAVANQVHDLDLADDLLSGEVKLLSQFKDMIVTVASNRAWSQAFFGLCFPYCLARLMEPTSVGIVRKLAEGILELEKAVDNCPERKALQELLEAVGTNYWIISREAFVSGLNHGWDINSNGDLKDMVFALFAGPNHTKGCLENTFSSVKDAFLRYNRNMRQGSSATKWMYTCTSPYAKEAGVRQIELDGSDFSEFVLSGGSGREKLEGLYNPRRHSIEDVVPKPQDIVREARKASDQANAHSAAAAALILHSMDRGNFETVEYAWAGPQALLTVFFSVSD